jgi:hypothetical protein
VSQEWQGVICALFLDKDDLIAQSSAARITEPEETAVDVGAWLKVTVQPTPWEKNTFVSMAYETHAIFMP